MDVVAPVTSQAATAATVGVVRSVTRAAVLDFCCVLAFVVIGRASHHDGETLVGVAGTLWPFVAGLAAGWLASRAWRRPAAFVPSGVAAWLGTVAVGMALRVAAGQGTAFAFILVALAFLCLFIIGWRALAALSVRLASRPPQPSTPRRR